MEEGFKWQKSTQGKKRYAGQKVLPNNGFAVIALRSCLARQGSRTLDFRARAQRAGRL